MTAFLPSRRIEITLYKVIKRPHVLLFCKQNMVGDTLENLWTRENRVNGSFYVHLFVSGREAYVSPLT